ncbi:hypothetical protein [Psychroserpens luteolus]|uniref:hypothetical protein n=1 Tax=Psychroserpens luteolus TaxID=2855840 RepID=UPI001E567BEA|nr:hypothetical protein [Psychroserpens luteolus]MCD2259280.1 hypothetical protein [Psychroserpens luteolus]
MYLSKILGIILILLSILFLGLQSLGKEFDAFGVKALAMTVLIILYFVNVKQKHILFILFLVTYAAAEIHNYFTYNLFPPENATYDIHYLIGNGLYISAYLFLIARILSIMNFRKAILRFSMQTLLLFALGIFVVYMITDLSKEGIGIDYGYTVEMVYNSIIMFLVCLALVNYMYNDSKKSMNLLIGSICIVFSEVIQIAYYYISDFDNTLSVIYSFFLVGAFVFFYLQSRLVQEYNAVYEQHQELKA